MGWSIGYDARWQRDIGYGVPAVCDQPDCVERIDRGLGYVCGGQPYGGEQGCGLYFCEAHLVVGIALEDAEAGASVEMSVPSGGQQCDRCVGGAPPYDPKPDLPEWLRWKLTDDSWRLWREENAEKVEQIRQAIQEPP